MSEPGYVFSAREGYHGEETGVDTAQFVYRGRTFVITTIIDDDWTCPWAASVTEHLGEGNGTAEWPDDEMRYPTPSRAVAEAVEVIVGTLDDEAAGFLDESIDA